MPGGRSHWARDARPSLYRWRDAAGDAQITGEPPVVGKERLDASPPGASESTRTHRLSDQPTAALQLANASPVHFEAPHAPVEFHLHTSKRTPAGAEISSHQLMLRAEHDLSWAPESTWSPLGLRPYCAVEAIVRGDEPRRRHR
jgi:hypothetical protein